MGKFKQKLVSGIVVSGLLLTNVAGPMSVFANTQAGEVKVYADWRFDTESIKSGSIATQDLVLADYSGNNNDLQMQTYGDAADYSQYMMFSDETMVNNTNGSLVIKGDSVNKVGADLITVDDAPINQETFENGYTIEFLYKLPGDWTVANRWMGLLSRQGESTSMDEPEVGTMTVALSNCKEIQFYAANHQDDHEMSSAAWSVSMDKGDMWYHIAITSDNHEIKTYVNGAEAFRDYVSDEMVGLYADPNDGRFRIGSSYWTTNENPLSKFAIGNYQQVRISEGALAKSDWLVSDPELYAGDYGNNDPYTLNQASNYTMAFLPDTQNTIKFKPTIIDTSMDWLVDNKIAINLAGVVHLGDIVQDPLAIDQWESARTFDTLPENDIKFLAQPGNHDDPALFDEYFGPESYHGTLTSEYIVRDSPSGRSGYMIYDGGSYQYMALTVDYYSIEQDLPWVEEVLSQTNMPTIITSHDLQNCSDAAPSAIKLSTRGQKIWDVVKQYNQVFMLIGGHSHGAGDEILINDAGNQVWSVLADYQFAYNGGNALYKFAEFDEVNNLISLSTFSPYVASLAEAERTFFDVNYLTGEGNYSQFQLNFATRFAGMAKSTEYLANQAALQQLLLDAELVDQETVTSESYQALVIAMEQAKVVLNLAEATTIELNAAVQQLTVALSGLVRLPDEVVPETPLPETEQPEIPEVSIPNEDVTDTVQPEPEVNVKPESQTKLPTTGQRFGVLVLVGTISTTAGLVVSRKRNL